MYVGADMKNQDRFRTEFFLNDSKGIKVGETTQREAKIVKSAGIVLGCLIFAAGLVIGALIF